jgi:hypothetical protein
MIETGWVYVITNESMPGLVKVGVTSNRPEQRAKELDETGSPTAYKVETAFLFSEAAERIEKRAHTLLADVRVRGNREWFRCLPQLAAEKVLDAADILNSVVLKNEPALLSQRDLLLRKKKKEEEQAAEALRRENEQAAENRKRENEQAAENRKQEQQKLIEQKRAATWDLYQTGLKKFNPLAKQARSGDFKAQLLIEYYNQIKPKRMTKPDGYWSIDEYDEPPGLSGEVLCFLDVLKTDPVKIFHYFKSVKIDPKYLDEIRVSLGHCYALGFGVKANPKMAFDLFKKSVKWRYNGDLGRLRAASALAQCYHLGFGVAKSPLKAALMTLKVKSLKRKVKSWYPRWHS